jgi:hypothetical protein
MTLSYYIYIYIYICTILLLSSTNLPLPPAFHYEATSYLDTMSNSNGVRTRGFEFAVLDPKGIL